MSVNYVICVIDSIECYMAATWHNTFFDCLMCRTYVW